MGNTGTEGKRSGAYGLCATPPITIVLDRPFLYAVDDEPTGEILFLGRLRDPSEQP
jgi:serine protease inhibitor